MTAPPGTTKAAPKKSKADAGPPFFPDAATVEEYVGKRSVTGSTTGATLDSETKPDAELEITYRVQFRFYRFWQTRVPTPAWFGMGAADDLADRVAKAPGGDVELETGERLCQFDVKDTQTIRVGKSTLALNLGESEKRSLPYWLPMSAKLPSEVKAAAPGWKWRTPVKQPDSSPDNQWGLRGDFAFRTKPGEEDSTGRQYKMVTVWQRWKNDKNAYTPDMCTLPPGLYAGYVRVMGNHAEKDEREKYPAIWVGYTWNAETSAWDLGVLGWVLKNPKSSKTTTSIFVHPGNFPNWFLGCLSPGPVDKETEWGFKEKDDAAQAMWDILADVGVKKKDYVDTTSYVDPDKKHKKWFIIKVKAGSPTVVASDGYKDDPIWVGP